MTKWVVSAIFYFMIAGSCNEVAAQQLKSGESAKILPA